MFPTEAPSPHILSPSPEGCLADSLHTGTPQSTRERGRGDGELSSHRKSSSPDLGAKVRYDDEFLEHIFGEDVREASFLYVVRRDVDVVGPQVEVGGGDGSHPPLRLGGESLPLIVGGCRDNYLVPMFVGGAGGGCCQLRLLLGLLLDLCNLLSLLRGSRNLHSQNYVPDLRLCQGRHVHTANTHTHWSEET